MQPSIVPPISFECGNVVFVARVIHGGHDKVCSGMHPLRNLAVKRGVASLVLADLLTVHPEPRTIVGRANVQKDARMFLRLVSEVALIPDRPLVIEERFALRVPVAGHLELGRLGEVVFDRSGILRLGLLVEEPSIRLFLMMEAEQAAEIGIDN